MNCFLSGCVFLAALVCSLFFLRTWKDMQDRFFLLFALAFLLLGVERLPIIFNMMFRDSNMVVYSIRLCAFALILGAIIDKNRQGAKTPSEEAFFKLRGFSFISTPELGPSFRD